VGVGGSIGEVPLATHSQSLVDGQLEAVVRLLDVAVLVGLTDIVGAGLEAIVGHQRLVASGGLLTSRNVEGADGGAEVVGAMLTGHPAKLPEATLEAFGQGFEALGEADLDRLDVGVGQHEVENQVREVDPTESDAEIGHVGEVGLGDPSRLVHLGEHDFLFGAVPDSPVCYLALESA
jgi:hypothetical protein